MLNVACPLTGLHSYIDRRDVYNNNEGNYGLEETPHVTLLYGLHKGVDLVDVIKVVDKFTFTLLKVGNVSKFDNPEYDVLKFGVEGPHLADCNKALKKLPNKSTFPNYVPHLTIGYLKKGTADKYIAMFKRFKIDTYPSSITFSTPEGDSFKIPIKINFN